MISPRTNNWG